MNWYVHSFQIYSVPKFITVVVIESSTLVLLMQKFLQNYKNLQNLYFFENPLMTISQYLVVSRSIKNIMHKKKTKICTHCRVSKGLLELPWTQKVELWKFFKILFVKKFGNNEYK